MEDNKKTNQDDKTSAVVDGATGWYNGIVGEFKRISWPTRDQIVKMSIAAIITSGIVGLIIMGYDFSLRAVYGWLVQLFN